MYRIKDLQFENRYFADGALYESIEEVCEQLIEYHSIDCDMSVEEKLLEEGRIEECLSALCEFEWAVEEV